MMLQPVDTGQNLIAPVQGRLQRKYVLNQKTTLFVDAHLERTMSRRQFKQLGIHSDLLR